MHSMQLLVFWRMSKSTVIIFNIFIWFVCIVYCCGVTVKPLGMSSLNIIVGAQFDMPEICGYCL